MGAITALAATVRSALQRIATANALVHEAQSTLVAAGTAYARLGDGSTQPHLGNAAAHVEHACDGCERAIATLDHAVTRAEAFLSFLTGPWQLSDQQVEDLRRQLPGPIGPDERGTGRKTHGRWIGPDGQVHQIVSGFDGLAARADAVLASLGFAQLAVASHVELKLAAYLRWRFETEDRPQHATIVQNNEPCPYRLGCASLLSLVLPSGCSLTVYAPDYRRTFVGGAGS